MPDFNAGEILVLVVIAVIIFGPDKLPELARKTARVFNYIRGIANDARTQIAEVVPELADLQLSDLNPRGLSTKLLGADTTAELTQAGRQAKDLGTQVRDAGRDAFREVGDTPAAAAAVTDPTPEAVKPVSAGAPTPLTVRVLAFDPEST